MDFKELNKNYKKNYEEINQILNTRVQLFKLLLKTNSQDQIKEVLKKLYKNVKKEYLKVRDELGSVLILNNKKLLKENLLFSFPKLKEKPDLTEEIIKYLLEISENKEKVFISYRNAYISINKIRKRKNLKKEEVIKKIGKAKLGKSCINVNKLEDIDLKILEKLIKLSTKAKVSNEININFK